FQIALALVLGRLAQRAFFKPGEAVHAVGRHLGQDRVDALLFGALLCFAATNLLKKTRTELLSAMLTGIAKTGAVIDLVKHTLLRAHFTQDLSLTITVHKPEDTDENQHPHPERQPDADNGDSAKHSHNRCKAHRPVIADEHPKHFLHHSSGVEWIEDEHHI